MKQLHIIEPKLKNMQGHYVRYALEISLAAIKEGFEPICWINTESTWKIKSVLRKNGIKVEPIFNDNGLFVKKIKTCNWLWTAFQYCYALNLIRKRSGKNDKIITFSGNIENFLGPLISSILYPKIPPLIFQFMLWETVEMKTRLNLQHFMIYRVTELVARRCLIASNIRIISQTETLAEYIQKRIGIKAPVAPMIVDWNSIQQTHGSTRKNMNVIGYIGNIRPEKGFHLLAGGLLEFGKECKNFSAIIQVNPVNSEYFKHVSPLISKLKKGHRIKLIEGLLSENEYADLLNTIDIIILPYDPHKYSLHRSSGIFTESIGLGKVAVAHKNTWMGYIIDRYQVGVTFNEYSSTSLSIALKQVLSEYETLKYNSNRLRNEWIQKNQPDYFFSKFILANN